jgi:hypothetical protein
MRAGCLLIALLLPRWAAAQGPPEGATDGDRAEPGTAERRTEDADLAARWDRACPARGRCCVDGIAPCVWPGGARAVLGAGGAALLLGGAAGLVLLSDSVKAGEPLGAMAGVGAVAAAGALLGAFVSALPGRVESAIPEAPETAAFQLALKPGGTGVVGESDPASLRVHAAPRFAISGASVRPLAWFDGDLGLTKIVDPSVDVVPLPVVGRRQRLAGGASVELIVPLCGPARPMRLGRVELRVRPSIDVLRTTWDPRSAVVRAIEQVAMLPTTVGARWWVSPRQSFTVYLGPRFDIVSVSDPGSRRLDRGAPGRPHLHAEAHWALRVPLTPRGRAPLDATGLLGLSYIHSRMAGASFDFSAARGFFGPFVASVDVAVRKPGSRFGMQIGAGYRIGRGGGGFLTVGLAAPEIAR